MGCWVFGTFFLASLALDKKTEMEADLCIRHPWFGGLAAKISPCVSRCANKEKAHAARIHRDR